MAEIPPYLIVVCEGERCRPMVAIADQDEQDVDPDSANKQLEHALATMASLLRTKGALGRLVLVNVDTGELIATRQIWP